MAKAATATRPGRSRECTKQGSRSGNTRGKPSGGSSVTYSSKNGKLTRSLMEAFLAKSFGITDTAAQSIWRAILDRIRKALVKGQPVALTNVGTLQPFKKQATQYRHPGCGELRTTPARKHIRFVISPSLKAALRLKRRAVSG
ncbi:hypothetical protein LCGC14_1933280 [marine sediment metagenome]|uniref:HU domain-containing protein n=1 Tax=marine sediment metagenome TaxID=412755 RepID=A0A0F9IK04_9ZZZZ